MTDTNATTSVPSILDLNTSATDMLSGSIEEITHNIHGSLSEIILKYIDIPKEITDIFSIHILGNTLGTWAVAFFVLFLFLTLQKQLLKLSTFILMRAAVIAGDKPYFHKIFTIIEKPLRWGIMVIGVIATISVLHLSEGIKTLSDMLINTAIIFILTWFFLRALTLFRAYLISISYNLNADLGPTFSKFFVTFIRAVILLIALINILVTWGINVNGFIASLGLVGMALALAAKDTASNFFGSVMIFTDAPFKIGDWIKTPEVEGTVEEIGMRSTKVRTFARALVSVPNAMLANSAILNWSRMNKRRIKMTIGLTYSTSSEQMRNILADIRAHLAQHKEIHQETIYINFTDFNDSSLGIFCYFFTNTTNWGHYMQVREEINLDIMHIVEKNGASFAFPSQSLYIETPTEKDTLS